MPEVGSETMDRLLEGEGNRLIVTTLSLLEVKSQLGQRCARGRLRLDEFEAVLGRIDRFVATWEAEGRMSRLAWRPEWEAETSALIQEAVGLRLPLEPEEAIHLVVAGKGPVKPALVSVSSSLLEMGEQLGFEGILLERSY